MHLQWSIERRFIGTYTSALYMCCISNGVLKVTSVRGPPKQCLELYWHLQWSIESVVGVAPSVEF